MRRAVNGNLCSAVETETDTVKKKRTQQKRQFIASSFFLKFRAICEQVQSLRIGERILVLYRSSVHHIAYSQFHDFSADRPRDIGNLKYLARNVARTSAPTYLLSDFVTCPSPD